MLMTISHSQAQAGSQSAAPNASQPAVKVVTRMVTLEVVVKDKKGNHVTGLTPEDFELYEQTPRKGEGRQQQKIDIFHEVSVADLAMKATPIPQVLTGVYTNAVALRSNRVPPTILLADGLNTPIAYQMQVHAQMVKMLRQLPSDVPVAVFLLGNRLTMLQDFTNDPALLQAAVTKATSVAGQGLAQSDPRDDVNSIGNLKARVLKGMPGEGGGAAKDMFMAIEDFDAAIYNFNMDRRVHDTADALKAIARYTAGLPVRKNLLWISTAFPIVVDPALDPFRNHDYTLLVQGVTKTLSEAKVAVYPMNPAGVVPPAVFDADRQGGDQETAASTSQGQGPSSIIVTMREDSERLKHDDTMRLLANGTGGEVCVGDNDLADCVHRAVDDSGDFYEIAYYSNSKDWNGEYRRIFLDATEKDWHLEYRQGYFATAEIAQRTEDVRQALKEATCATPLDATSIALTATTLPPDSPDGLKFHLDIGASALTLTPAENGGAEVNLQLAVCTFDKKGNPGQFMSIPLDRKMNEAQVQKVAAGGLADIAAIPGPRPSSIRLAVMDVPSGRIGSLRIQMDDVANAARSPNRVAKQ
jgi:VWFA-related protein